MNFFKRFLSKFLPPGASAESPESVYRILQKVHEYMQLHSYENARALLLEVMAKRDRIEDANVINYSLTTLATVWLLTEKYEDGIRFFSDYAVHYPGESEAFCQLGAFYWYVGRLQEAISCYSRSLELKPKDISSLSGRGQVLAEMGDCSKAIEDLDLALATLDAVEASDSGFAEWYEQSEAFVRNGKGFALGTKGEIEAALHEFELSIGLSPENAWVYHNRAQVEELAGNKEAARADYRAALTRENPSLNPIRRRHAETRLHELRD